MSDWRAKASALADELAASNELSPQWRAAFEAMPRHLFLPGVDWNVAYANDAVVTQYKTGVILGGGKVELATSSASAPGVQAVMLGRLDVHKGHRVLEIGTGTGINTGLLCFQIGEDSVYSVELDPTLTAAAQARLAEVGHRPHLRAGDGYAGWPEHAPFDRIIATCSIDHIPPAWIQQLAEGGRIVAPLTGGGDCGLLVLDKTAPDEVTGRFDNYLTAFMPLRDEIDNPIPTRSPWGVPAGPMSMDGTTTLDPRVVRDADPDLWLWLHLHIPGLRIGGLESEGKHSVTLAAPGAEAIAELDPVEPGRWPVHHRGHARLWDTAEHAITLWRHLGKPRRERLGITALDDPDRQYVWLDNPNSHYSWPMPL